MCGCLRNSSNSKISGMKKSAVLGNLNSVLLGAGGFIVAKQLDRVQFIAANPLVGALAKAGLGLVIAANKNKTIAPIGMGMAVAGVTQLAGNFLQQAGVAGFLPYRSTDVASVAGDMPNVIVN